MQITSCHVGSPSRETYQMVVLATELPVRSSALSPDAHTYLTVTIVNRNFLLFVRNTSEGVAYSVLLEIQIIMIYY
jgi:hypothetical protein